MSDPNVEEESLISQDDIDKLLDSSSIEETEEQLETGEEAGELSQADIDALMGGNDPVAAEDDAEEEEEEAGELSQADIDALMGGNDPVDEEPPPEDSDSDDSGDIDEEDSDEEDSDDELISMEDVQTLMDEEKTDDPAPTDETVEVSDDYVIDAAEALDVSQCLITQETLDKLIKDTSGDVPEPVVEDADSVELGKDLESEPVSPGEEESDEQGGNEIDLEASPDELDDLLNTDLDDTELDLGTADSDDVTQEDIDALLQESDEDEDYLEDEDDILISQDDIDTLLMAADQEDEDLLGDLMGDDLDDSLDDDFDDEDILDHDVEDVAGAGGEQVVLEEMEEDESTSSAKSRKKWYKSRIVIATASAMLVLGICVPTVYFLFFAQNDMAQLPESRPVQVTMETSGQGRDIEVASVDINTSPVAGVKKSGNIILADFVILSSDLSRDTYHEINDNLSFYRDLIYESIQKNLVWEKRNEVTEEDLIWGIESTLKKVLPADYIEKVSFKSFKAS